MDIEKARTKLINKIKDINGFQAAGIECDDDDNPTGDTIFVMWSNHETQNLIPEEYKGFEVSIVFNDGPCPCPYCAGHTTMN